MNTNNTHATNMTEMERVATLIGGGALALYGLRRRDPVGFVLALVGAGAALQGATGHSPLNEAIGVRRYAGAGNAFRGPAVRVDRSIIVERPIQEVYRFWRNFENLPRFMKHLISVRPSGHRRYQWVARAPMSMKVEWEAEVIEDVEPWLISWRSVPGSQIRNAGSVRFAIAHASRGTEIHVNLAYKPPAGPWGALVARMLGEEPSIQVRDDLRHFKHIMESNEISAESMRRLATRTAEHSAAG